MGLVDGSGTSILCGFTDEVDGSRGLKRWATTWVPPEPFEASKLKRRSGWAERSPRRRSPVGLPLGGPRWSHF